ncbi:hypothetical protein D3C73_1255700 [compost metagenome]
MTCFQSIGTAPAYSVWTSNLPPSNRMILPLSLSPFFNQTVSASKGVEAVTTARHSKVLDNISK